MPERKSARGGQSLITSGGRVLSIVLIESLHISQSNPVIHFFFSPFFILLYHIRGGLSSHICAVHAFAFAHFPAQQVTGLRHTFSGGDCAFVCLGVLDFEVVHIHSPLY